MPEFGSALQAVAADRRFVASEPGSRPGVLRHQDVSSKEAAEALESVENVFFPHQVVVRSQQLDFNHCGTFLGDISLNHIAYGADVDVLITELQRTHFVLVISFGGEASVQFNQRISPFHTGDCVFMSPDVRYNFQMSGDHSHLAVGIPSHRLAGSGRPFEDVHSVLDHGGEAQRRGAGHILPYIEYLCSELRTGSPAFGLQSVVAAHENSFLSLVRATLFDCESSVRHASVLPAFVRRADQFIGEHLTDDIQLEDILTAAGVPARTLYHGFEQFLGYSPMRWLRRRRLERARADIVASDGRISITELANRYWFGHYGRFANMFSELHGEVPSVTLNRAREAAANGQLPADGLRRHRMQ